MVERFHQPVVRVYNGEAVQLVPAADGRWVRYSDYEQLVDGLEREIERLRGDADAAERETRERFQIADDDRLGAAKFAGRAEAHRYAASRLSRLIKEHGGGGSGSEPCRRCGSRKCAEQQEVSLDLLEAMDDDGGGGSRSSVRPTHNPQIERLDNGCYRPGCLCGWRGVARRGRHEAERDFFAHGSGTRAEGS